MNPMLPFSPDCKCLQEEHEAKKKLTSSNKKAEATVFDVKTIPYELNIFLNTEAYFLPEGKTFADLTPEELEVLRGQYRFSPFRPGMYQGITGIGGPGFGGS